MPVGNAPTSAALNAELSGLIVRLRDVCLDIINLQTQVTGIGSAGLIAAGFVSADATTYLGAVGNLNTVAGVYKGTVQQGGSGGTGASAFNFDNALSGFVVGQ